MSPFSPGAFRCERPTTASTYRHTGNPWRGVLCASVACALLFIPSARAAAAGQADGTVRALSIAYADGRTALLVLRTRFSMWTPMFPRVRAEDGNGNGNDRAPRRLDLSGHPEGDDVVVDVSLGYDAVAGDKVLVEQVRATPRTPVRVEKLRDYGVEPVILSIVRLAAPTIPLLDIECASGALDVRVDAIPDRPAEHRVTIVNDSLRAVHAFDWEMRRGSEHALSGRRRGERGAPLLRPGGTDTFLVIPSAGTTRGATLDAPAEWSPFDRLVITAVLWQDGLVEGSSGLAVSERQIGADAAAEIGRVLERVRGAVPQSAAHLLEVIDVLPPATTIGERLVRDAVGADTARFERQSSTPGAGAFDEWLAERLVSYGQWRDRIRAMSRLGR
jgi:hypothetical protein